MRGSISRLRGVGMGRTGQDGMGEDGKGQDGPYLAAAAPGRTMLRSRGGSGGGVERSGAEQRRPQTLPPSFSLSDFKGQPKAPGLPARRSRRSGSPQPAPAALIAATWGEAGGRAGGIHTSRPGMPPPRLTPRLPRRRPAAASRFPEARPGGHRRGEPAPHACVPAGPRSAGLPPGSPGRMLSSPSLGTLRRMLRFPPRGGCSAFPHPRALPGRMRRSPPRAAEPRVPAAPAHPIIAAPPKKSRHLHGHCAAASCLWDGWIRSARLFISLAAGKSTKSSRSTDFGAVW